LINILLHEYPDARLIVLTERNGEEDIYRALQAGARSYLFKSTSLEEMVEAIRAVYTGQLHLPSSVAQRLAERIAGSELTRQEVRVLELIAQGNSNKEIAMVLSITEGTVKNHVNRILGKMGGGDRTSAATLALKRGIIHLER
jgi:two-component system NarL family response regulator